MVKYVIFLDANVIIYASKVEYSHVLDALAASDDGLACSEMVRLEVLGFKGLMPLEQTLLKKFFNGLNVLPIDRPIIDEAIKIRQKKAIGAPDAIIAATAMKYGGTLWSSNIKDFDWIPGLSLYNPVG